MSEAETYKQKALCGNCGVESDIEIPKGVEIDRFINTAVCPNCGCDYRKEKLVYLTWGI
jgi:transcription elongation factor Elf1